MKKAIHVKEYTRKRHGRAKFGGKVRAHDKSGRATDEEATPKSVLYRYLETKGITPKEADKLVKEKNKEFAGLLSNWGALYYICRDKGMPAGYGGEPKPTPEYHKCENPYCENLVGDNKLYCSKRCENADNAEMERYVQGRAKFQKREVGLV